MCRKELRKKKKEEEKQKKKEKKKREKREKPRKIKKKKSKGCTPPRRLKKRKNQRNVTRNRAAIEALKGRTPPFRRLICNKFIVHLSFSFFFFYISPLPCVFKSQP